MSKTVSITARNHLRELPMQLQLRIAATVTSPQDRASLILAHPRLGIAALKHTPGYHNAILVGIALRLRTGGSITQELLRRHDSHVRALIVAAVTDIDQRIEIANALRMCAPPSSPSWRVVTEPTDPLFIIARRLHAGEPMDENMVRGYAANNRASHTGCIFLNKWAMAVGSPLRLSQKLSHPSRDTVWHVCEGEGDEASVWRAARKVREESESGAVRHYEGAAGAERRVRTVWSSGREHQYEGEKGVERMVRILHESSVVEHYEGDRDAEHLVRIDHPCGREEHFEGEKGNERKVRFVYPDDRVEHFEGDRHNERKLRVVYADGRVEHFRDLRGRERLVRVVHADGRVERHCWRTSSSTHDLQHDLQLRPARSDDDVETAQ